MYIYNVIHGIIKVCNDENYVEILLKCKEDKEDTLQKPILLINNAKNETGHKYNHCYKELNLKNSTQVSCLKENYNAIVILDGKYYKQRTSHPPKDYFSDTQLPVVSISYLGHNNSYLKLETAGHIRGSIFTNSLDKILEAKNQDKFFNFHCDTKKCHRFKEGIVLGKSFTFDFRN